MLLEAALTVAIQVRQPSLPLPQVQLYAKTIAEQSTKKRLDPWTFMALIDVETGRSWSPYQVHLEHNGDCSVGLGQVRAVDCDPDRIAFLLDPVNNLVASASVQQAARRWCTLHACPHGWIYLYNRSRKYVVRVRSLAEEIRRGQARREPAVRPVRG